MARGFEEKGALFARQRSKQRKTQRTGAEVDGDVAAGDVERVAHPRLQAQRVRRQALRALAVGDGAADRGADKALFCWFGVFFCAWKGDGEVLTAGDTHARTHNS